MNFLMNFIGILCMPFLIATTNPTSTSVFNKDTDEYCNKRYQFCITYPENFFTGKDAPDNGDGMTFFDDTRDITFKISGSYNVMNWNLEDIYYFSFENFSKEGDSVVNLSNAMNDTYYTTTFLVDGQLHYFETHILDDSFVTMSVVLPEKEADTLERIKEDINLVVNI